MTAYQRWFPAIVQLPDGGELLRACKVYATDRGLLVFTAPGEPMWESPIDFTTTRRPGNARNGVKITTEAGDVMITAGGGCGCGNPLKRFTPQIARRVAAWPTPVKLVLDVTAGWQPGRQKARG